MAVAQWAGRKTNLIPWLTMVQWRPPVPEEPEEPVQQGIQESIGTQTQLLGNPAATQTRPVNAPAATQTLQNASPTLTTETQTLVAPQTTVSTQTEVPKMLDTGT